MRRITLLFAFLVLVAGCGERAATPAEVAADASAMTARAFADDSATEAQRAKDRQVAQVAANLGPISEAVAAKGQPGLGAVVAGQRDSLVGALDIKAKDMPLPVVRLEQLMKNAEAALLDYRLKNADLQSRADQAAAKAEAAEAARVAAEGVAAAERTKADGEARTAWWMKVGTGAVGVLGLVATLAARLGLPGGGLVAAGIDLVSPMLRKRGDVAESAVAAADVGRQGLGVIEALLAQKHPELAQQLSAVVSAATGGRADGLEGLFKACAKAYTLDHSGEHAEAVDSLLTKLRGERIATTGGTATSLQGIIKPA